EIENGESILAIGGEIVSELHPAARAEWKAIDMSALITLRQWVARAGLLGDGVTDGQFRRQPGRADVLVEECRRDTEGRGDILETAHLDLRGQQVLGVDFHPQ